MENQNDKSLVVQASGARGVMEQHAMKSAEAKGHVAMVKDIMANVMEQDKHYGVIPGTGKKPTLYLPGGQLLCMAFKLRNENNVEDLSTSDEIRYRVTVILSHQPTGMRLGEGVGEASTNEEKYKWRGTTCQEEFDATPEAYRRSKWKKGQTNAYEVKQVRTNPADLANTVLKMATKRGFLAAVLTVTAASDVFNQDLEDFDKEMRAAVVGEDGNGGGVDEGKGKRQTPQRRGGAAGGAGAQQSGGATTGAGAQPTPGGAAAATGGEAGLNTGTGEIAVHNGMKDAKTSEELFNLWNGMPGAEQQVYRAYFNIRRDELGAPKP